MGTAAPRRGDCVWGSRLMRASGIIKAARRLCAQYRAPSLVAGLSRRAEQAARGARHRARLASGGDRDDAAADPAALRPARRMGADRIRAGGWWAGVCNRRGVPERLARTQR